MLEELADRMDREAQVLHALLHVHANENDASADEIKLARAALADEPGPGATA